MSRGHQAVYDFSILNAELLFGSLSKSLIVEGGGVTFKTRVFTEEGQSNCARRSVTLLGYDNLGGAFLGTIFVIYLVPIDK